MVKKVVFIMGPGHCGSTLLDLILGSHSKTFSLAELHAISKRLEFAKRGNTRLCSICSGKCAFWDERVSFSVLKLFYSRKSKLSRVLFKLSRYFFNPYHFVFRWSNKSILIDSSKQPHWFNSQLTPFYTWKNIVPYLIYLSRDGRAVINSYLRKYPERGIVQVTETWKDQISRMNNFYDQFPNKKTKVKYEDLAMHPERVIKFICHFADIQYEKEMLRYWKHEHHPIYGNLGTHSLVFKYREKFGDNASKHCQEINSGDKYFVEKYYEQVGLAIKLDMRWVDELSAHQIETFDSIAGDINAPFVCDLGYSR